MKIDLSDLVSQREAAEMRGVTIQAISFLVKRGRFTIVEVSGKQFLLRKEVAQFKPSVGGRPRKDSTSKKAGRTARAAKSGSGKQIRSGKKKTSG